MVFLEFWFARRRCGSGGVELLVVVDCGKGHGRCKFTSIYCAFGWISTFSDPIFKDRNNNETCQINDTLCWVIIGVVTSRFSKNRSGKKMNKLDVSRVSGSGQVSSCE